MMYDINFFDSHSFFLLLMIKYFSVTDQVPTLEIFMNETAFIIQNRLREATVSLERAVYMREHL